MNNQRMRIEERTKAGICTPHLPSVGGRRRGLLLLALVLALLLDSCTSLRYAGVDRIRRYDVVSADVGDALDGYRIAFASDFHLVSRFGMRQLQGTVKALRAVHPDVLLLGGDYQEGCAYVEPLFDALAGAVPRDGVWAVLGNNDCERCTAEIAASLQQHGFRLLDYEAAAVREGLVVVGVPFCTHPPLVQPLVEAQDSAQFVVLLTHSPDIVEMAAMSPAHIDLALAGHTHGGQITLLGLVAPVSGSRYGQRFLRGISRTRRGVPVITSCGLGTSRIPLRMGAPTDIILVTLHSKRYV